MSENNRSKRGPWKSLLSALLDGHVEEMDIYLAEVAPGEEWDFAFWQYDDDGVMVAYRCPFSRNIWEPVETPAYTGKVIPYERDDDKYADEGLFRDKPD